MKLPIEIFSTEDSKQNLESHSPIIPEIQTHSVKMIIHLKLQFADREESATWRHKTDMKTAVPPKGNSHETKMVSDSLGNECRSARALQLVSLSSKWSNNYQTNPVVLSNC